MPATRSDARKRMEEAKAMKTTIIGLSGWAQSGKDSTADVMEQFYGFEKRAFAEALRSVARAANPLVRYTGQNYNGYAMWSVEQVYQGRGDAAYEWLKSNTTYREFLQNLGTAVREYLGPLAWVDACMHTMEPGGSYVVTDVRFKNEAQAIKDRGGQVWRIRRAGHQAANDHISEHDLDYWDFDRVLSMPDYADDLDALRLAVHAQLSDILYTPTR